MQWGGGTRLNAPNVTLKGCKCRKTRYNEVCLKKGFTLAEVLITLGIIGVVAALTMPAVITKYHQAQMEASFKKAYSALQQAMYSIDPDVYATLSSSPGDSNTEFYLDLYSKYRIVSDKDVSRMYLDKSNRTTLIKTYTKKYGSMNGCAQLPSRIAFDGSAIGGLYNCYANWISLDTNGPKKGPNAYGHDIFYFGLSAKGKLIPLGESYHWEMANNTEFCSRNSTNLQNGASCAKFAVSNTCPDDDTKTYWECLP